MRRVHPTNQTPSLLRDYGVVGHEDRKCRPAYYKGDKVKRLPAAMTADSLVKTVRTQGENGSTPTDRQIVGCEWAEPHGPLSIHCGLLKDSGIKDTRCLMASTVGRFSGVASPGNDEVLINMDQVRYQRGLTTLLNNQHKILTQKRLKALHADGTRIDPSKQRHPFGKWTVSTFGNWLIRVASMDGTQVIPHEGWNVTKGISSELYAHSAAFQDHYANGFTPEEIARIRAECPPGFFAYFVPPQDIDHFAHAFIVRRTPELS